MHGTGLLIHLAHVSGVQYLLQIVLALYGTEVYVATTLTLNATLFLHSASMVSHDTAITFLNCFNQLVFAGKESLL
jgi:hypothetical protein